MAFVSAITSEVAIFGSRQVKYGTYTNAGGDTGGEVITGLKSVEHITLQATGSAVNTGVPVVNETLPLASGSVTIVTDDGADGVWMAIGKIA